MSRSPGVGEPSFSDHLTQSRFASLRTQYAVAGIDDERRSEWETSCVTADNVAFTELFESFAGDPGRMVKRRMLKDSGRQFGDRLKGLASGQFRGVALADRFEVGVHIGLLSEIFERVRVVDA